MRKKVSDLKKICLMCMLTKKPMHGYEMMKELGKRFSKNVGPGFIYPLLSDMEKKGLIESKIIPEGKREKKVYSLTDEGKNACREEKECIKDILKEFF